MKRLGFFICVLTVVVFFLLIYATCKAGTIEELKVIAEKYFENPIVMEDHGDHICVFVLNMEKTEVVAVDVRSLDLKICFYFFEKVDGVMTLVWTNPGIIEMEKKARDKNSV
jgi:hypothetical protein